MRQIATKEKTKEMRRDELRQDESRIIISCLLKKRLKPGNLKDYEYFLEIFRLKGLLNIV